MINDYQVPLPWDIASQPKRRELRTALIKRTTYNFTESESPATFTALDADSAQVPLAVMWQDKHWFLDPDDSTTPADLITVLVTADGYRYKTNGIDLRVRSVLSRTTTVAPSSPALGDAYIVPIAGAGIWSSHDNDIAIFTQRNWQYIESIVGMWILVEDEDSFVRFTAAGAWTVGPGSLTYGDRTIPMSAAINFGRFVLVENQTQDYPPGSRRTGAVPSMPFGGTAANINDDSDSTVAVTGALGDLTGLPVGSRIVAKLSLGGAAQTLNAIRARAIKTSSTTVGAQGLYYSNDNITWTQAGTDFTITPSNQNVLRTGSFLNARYVAIVASATNWAAVTWTLGGLDAFADVIDASPPAAYVIGPNPIGPFIGSSGKIAIFEAEDTFTIYTPPEGSMIYDRALLANYQYRGGVWLSAAGKWITNVQTFSASGSYVPTARTFRVKVKLVAEGGDTVIAGGVSSFGAHCSATGGPPAATPIVHGVGSGGNLNNTGNAIGLGTKGTGLNGAGNGGSSMKWIDKAALGASEVVTLTKVGAAANNPFCMVEEFIEA